MIFSVLIANSVCAMSLSGSVHCVAHAARAAFGSGIVFALACFCCSGHPRRSQPGHARQDQAACFRTYFVREVLGVINYAAFLASTDRSLYPYTNPSINE